MTIFRRAAVLAIGLLVALCVPAVAAAQVATDAGARVAELRALTASVRQAVAALGSAAPSPALVGDLTRRRQLLHEVAEIDPRAALEAALTPAEVSALPASLSPLAEKWVYRVGHVGIEHADVPGATATGGYSVYLVEDGQQTALRLAASARARQPNEKILVAGIELASDGTIVADDVTVLAAIAPKSPLGVQRTALFLANAAGAPAHPYADKTNTASLYFSRTSGQSLYAFVNEASYGQTQVAGSTGGAGTAADVFGPYNVPLTCSTSTLIPNLMGQADAEVNFNNYDRLVVLLNHPSSCSYAGIASVGVSNRGTYDGATQYLSYSVNVNTANGSTALNGKVGGTVLHEYGHNLGLYHAWTVSCGTAALSATGCSQIEYGDPADVMGRSYGYGHYNAAYKEQLGWLANGAIQTVTTSGTYTLGNTEGSSGVRALKVPRERDANGNATAYYYLEYRVPTASWRSYATTWPNYDRGVLAHVVAPEGTGPATHSQLVDTRPASITGETTSAFSASDADDAPIRAGQTFVDNASSVTIAVNSTGPTSATLNVNVTPPTLTVGSTTAQPGSTIAVSWSGMHQPSTTDWFGLFATTTTANSSPLGGRRYLNCGASASGISTPIASGTCKVTIPPTVASGDYEFRFFPANSANLAARSATVEVTGGAVPTATPTPTRTRTITPTRTRTLTRTITPTRTITLTRTPSRTRTVTPTRTRTLTRTTTTTRTVTRTRTVTPTRTVTFTRTATRTRVPSVTRTSTPVPAATLTRTATPIPQRVTWQTQGLTAVLAPGQTATLNATLTARRSVDNPAFQVFSRDNAVTIDLSSLPTRIDAGQSYTIRLNATMPGTVQEYALVNLLDEAGRPIQDHQVILLNPA